MNFTNFKTPKSKQIKLDLEGSARLVECDILFRLKMNTPQDQVITLIGKICSY